MSVSVIIEKYRNVYYNSKCLRFPKKIHFSERYPIKIWQNFIILIIYECYKFLVFGIGSAQKEDEIMNVDWTKVILALIELVTISIDSHKEITLAKLANEVKS